MKKFFIIICAVVGVFTVAALAASAIAISYLNRDPDIVIPPPAENGPGPVQNGPRQTPTPRPTLEPGETIPRFTNVLVVGVDDHGLTDIVMAMVFNRDTGAVNLLNIPRDTAAVFSPGLADTMRANGLNLRHDNILRINQIRNYGRAHGMQFLQQYLEELFGVSFHFRVEVNMQAFHRLVDAVEGVWIDVTFHMHYVQGGEIDINIPPGLHLMDGAMAEQFIRYRGYGTADIGRIQAQQRFFIQLFRQVLAQGFDLSFISNTAVNFLSNVTTNIAVTDLMGEVTRYLPYFIRLDPENISAYTLPGIWGRIGDRAAQFWVLDYAQIIPLANRVFRFEYEPTPPVQVPSELVSRDARILVLNAGNVAGAAMHFADILTAAGYTNVTTGVHTGARIPQNRIRMSQADFNRGLGTDLPLFLNNPLRETYANMPPNVDIIIIIGTTFVVDLG